MERIVAVHYPNLKKRLLSEALETFFEIRDVPGLKKRPSTSELLDWIKLLVAEDIPPEALRGDQRKADPAAVRGVAEKRTGRAFVRAVAVHVAAQERLRMRKLPVRTVRMMTEFFSSCAKRAFRSR
jgi:MoxR-like ATPase